MPRPALLLVKKHVLTGHDAHYAGGMHLFRCMAVQLAQSKQLASVHVFSTAAKAVVMHYAITHQLLHKLQVKQLSNGCEAILWREPQGVHHHVIVREQHPPAAPAQSSGNQTTATCSAPSTDHRTIEALLAAVTDTAALLAKQGLDGAILLDVDTLQHQQLSSAMPLQQAREAPATSQGDSQAVPTAAAAAAASAAASRGSAALSAAAAPASAQAAAGLTLHTDGASSMLEHPSHMQRPVQGMDATSTMPFMLALVLQLQHLCLHGHQATDGQQCALRALPAHTLGAAPQATAALHASSSPQPATGCQEAALDHKYQQQQQQQSPGADEASRAGLHKPLWKLLVLVQNLHHLPFGPCGTAPRSLAQLDAWQQVTGVLCVSQFVKSYLQHHALPLLSQLQQQHLLVVHPAAFQVWGTGPFPDLGVAAAARLWGSEPAEPAAAAGQRLEHAGCLSGGSDGSGSGSNSSLGDAKPLKTLPLSAATSPKPVPVQPPAVGLATAAAPDSSSDGLRGAQQETPSSHRQQQQQQSCLWQQPPVVGMLKLTREKGSDLFFALASQRPDWQFLAVCAEPALQQQARRDAYHNRRLLPPAADVSAVLQHMSILLVPSVLHEAFGMVVMDAQLHGLPVIVAAAGALPEAAAGAAVAVLPVNMAQFPAATQHARALACAPAAAAGGMGDCSHTVPPSSRAGCSNLADAAADHAHGHSALQSVQHLHQGTSTCCHQACADAPAAPRAAEAHHDPSTACVSCWLGGQRSWSDRVLPSAQQQQQRDVCAWADAVQRVLSSREAYMTASRRCRAAAQQALQQGAAALPTLVTWLQDQLS